MPLRSSNVYGLALGDREVCAARPGAASASWSVPAGLSLNKPAEFGRALGAFLKASGLGGKAVVGVPARWLITEGREVPPAGREQALAALRLQAERVAGEDEVMLFDVAGPLGQSKAARVVLAGMSGRRLAGLREMLEAAGVSPVAVTATGLATAPADWQGPAIVATPQGMELVWRDEVGLRAYRHLGPAGASAATLALELRRVFAMVGGSAEIRWFGDAPPDEQSRQKLAELLGTEVTVATVSVAAALASTGRTPPLDFLRPKLAAAAPPRFNPRIVVGVAAAFLAVGAVGLLYRQASAAEQDAQFLEARLDAMKPEVDAARARLAQFNYGRGFFETRPPVLDMLGELAGSLGPDDPVWATQFSARETGAIQLQGRADDQRAVIRLRDSLMANPNLTGVQLLDLREAAGAGRTTTGGQAGGQTGVTFSLGFRYVGPGVTGEGSRR